MRTLRSAGLMAGLILLAALPASSIAIGAPDQGRSPLGVTGQCGLPGLPPCPPTSTAAIHIAKTAVPLTLPAGGGSVTYTYAVTNPGTVPLAGITVLDDKCAPVTFAGGDTNSNTALDVGETWTYTCTMTVTAATTNTATATGKDATGRPATATATATVTVSTTPGCLPGSADPNCVPPPCPPPATGPNCPPPPPPPIKTTLVYECFDLQSKLDPRAVALLITKNFGNDTVLVRKSRRMCEPALKTKTRPPTGTTAPQVFPNAELSLDLMDPQGALHTIMLDGTMAQQSVAPGGVYDTQLLQLSLEGTAPLRMQSPDGSFFDSFFDVFVELDHAAPSPGRANSFFDIFITGLSLQPNAMLGVREAALRLMPGGSLRFLSNQQGSFMLAPAKPIPLLDPNGQPSGWTIGRGTLTPTPTPTPNQVMTRVVECFNLERGADLNDPYSLRTTNFGVDTVMVHRAAQLCEGAIKSRQRLDGAATPQPAPRIWECFDIASVKPIRPTPFFLTTRNFGLDSVLVLKANLLCEEAMKIRLNAAGTQGETIGQPTGRVLECFTIEAKTRNVPFFLRTRNFGLDPVLVGRGALMCEPAVKTPLGKFAGN